MKQLENGFVPNRVLKINVGFLITGGPGASSDSVLDLPPVRVAEDLDVYYVRGPIRLSRTHEGMLVQAELRVGVEDECGRCLDPVRTEIPITVTELYAYPPRSTSEFSISDDMNLDLAPLIRSEVYISNATGVLCKPDCKGLCPECGTNWNHATCTCNEDLIDPRLAALKKYL